MNNVVMGYESEEAKAVKQLAIKQMGAVARLKEQVQSLNEQIKEKLESDGEYQELQNEIEELKVKQKNAKDRITSEEANAALVVEKKDLQRELKDQRESLSSSLVTYKIQTQLSVFEDENFEYRVALKGAAKRKVKKQ